MTWEADEWWEMMTLEFESPDGRLDGTFWKSPSERVWFPNCISVTIKNKFNTQIKTMTHNIDNDYRILIATKAFPYITPQGNLVNVPLSLTKKKKKPITIN